MIRTKMKPRFCSPTDTSYKWPLGQTLYNRIKRDLPIYGSFDPDAVNGIYGFIWYPKTYQSCHTVICDRDQTFLLQ